MQDVFENVQNHDENDGYDLSISRRDVENTHIQTGTGRAAFLGPKYLHLIKQISRRRLNLLVISLDDVADNGDDGEGEMLARNIERNAKRYVK